MDKLKVMTLLAFIMSTVISDVWASEMMDVSFPVVLPGKMELVNGLYRLPYSIVFRKVQVPTNRLGESCAKSATPTARDCMLQLIYAFVDGDGNRVSSLTTGMVQGVGVNPNDPNTFGTWRHFLNSLNLDEQMSYNKSATGSVLASYFDNAQERYNVKTVCLAFQYAPTMNTDYPNLPVLDACVGLIPPDVTCNLASGDINFSYGNLNRSSASGTSLSHKINVECTGGDVSLGFRLSTGNDEIPLSNGMTAKLTLNDHALDARDKITQNKVNSLKLTSTLSGTANATGPFTGSAVLIGDYL